MQGAFWITALIGTIIFGVGAYNLSTAEGRRQILLNGIITVLVGFAFVFIAGVQLGLLR